jgi:xanthine dehydrogenase YagR molybdenum-binding subunit
MVEGPAQVMYACPNVNTEVRSVFTNTGPTRSFRGPGYVEGSFPLESLMDELAVKLDLDPIEIRLKNYARVDPRTGLPFSAKNLDKCYRKGARLIGWHDKPDGHNGVKRRLSMASRLGEGGGPGLCLGDQ